MLAVLRRSEVQLRKAIKSSSQSVNEVNNMGQTAINLSLDWPIGIKLLLDAKVELDRADNHGFTPIMNSCERSLLDAVRLLGNAEKSVNAMRALAVAIEKEFKVRVSNGATERTEIAEKIVDYIVELESDRRRQLHKLALSSLPSNALNDLELSGLGLLDEHAMSTVSMLKKYDIAVPNALIPAWERTTVYHAKCLTVRIANKLWMAGFKDIGVLDRNGRTPMNGMSRLGFLPSYSTIPPSVELELLAWFQSKGEDLQGIEDFSASMCPTEGRFIASNMHCNAFQLGRNLSSFSRRFDYSSYYEMYFDSFDVWVEKICAEAQFTTHIFSDLSDVAKRILTVILMDRTIDSCACACSIGGCSAIVMTLKGCFMDYADHSQLKAFINTIALVEFIESLEPRSSCLVSDILRLWTFNTLKLSHTCCNYGIGHGTFMKSDDEDEIQRIHDEEQVMLGNLEELLVEFENKKTELEVSTVEFLLGYWRERMREVLIELGFLNTDGVEPLSLDLVKVVPKEPRRRLTVKKLKADSENKYGARAENDVDAETKNENEMEAQNEEDTNSSDSDDNDSVYFDAE